MRKLFLFGLFAALGLSAGCATVTRTSKENANNFRSIVELDALAITDDVNMVFLAERQPRLSRWHTR